MKRPTQCYLWRKESLTDFVPIETKDEAEKIAKMSPIELLQFSHRLQDDWPAKADKPKIYWIGKKIVKD